MQVRIARSWGFSGFCALILVAPNVHAQEPGPVISTLDDLTRLTPGQLEALYSYAPTGTIPTGRVKGRALLRPGTKLGPLISKGAVVAWQGKVFDADGRSSINRFFGVKMVRADVSYGPSWRDGNPAIILEYGQTSKLYAPYRDELREVAPGLFLGLMFDRRTSPPRTEDVLRDPGQVSQEFRTPFLGLRPCRPRRRARACRAL